MLSPGSMAPDLELQTTEGGTESLATILLGGPAVLVFFKINCPTCQLTMPFVQRIADAAVPGSPRLVPISQNNSRDTAQFLQHFGVTLPTLLDKDREGFPASSGFRIDHVPSIFVLAQDGTVETSFTGFVKTELESLGERFGVTTFRPGETVPALKPG